MGVFLLLAPAAHAAGAMNNLGLSPDAAQVYLGINAGFYWGAGLSGALFLFAFAWTTLSTGAFPAWLGWASIALAAWLVIVPIAWIGLVYAFPVWLIAVSVILWTRSRSDSRPDPARRTP
jgi:hypothetical protein